MKVFIDTGAFLALADTADSSHEIAALAYQDALGHNASLYTTNYVIDETVTLIRARVSHRAAVSFLKGLDISGIKVLRVTEDDERAAQEIFIKYKDKDFSFTDCASFALIDRYSLNAALALDEHFSQYRYKHTVRHLLMG